MVKWWAGNVKVLNGSYWRVCWSGSVAASKPEGAVRKLLKDYRRALPRRSRVVGLMVEVVPGEQHDQAPPS